MTKLIVYSLIGCPFSKNTENIINENKINADIIKISRNNMNEYKIKNNMLTFPQIFIDVENERSIIGGNNDLENIIKIIEDGKKNKDLEYIKKKINELLPYKKRTILEIIYILIKINMD